MSVNENQSILTLTHEEAQRYFFKTKSYCNADLPPYIQFGNLLDYINEEITKIPRKSLYNSKNIRDLDHVNHTIYSNKDGKHAWRPIELINPVLYVKLVQEITEKKNWESIQRRFNILPNSPIKCMSIPVQSNNNQSDKAAQISKWWEEIEQKSIILALDYEQLIHVDIADCYGSIYTHSIAWALHDKSNAKENRKDDLLIGNIIDTYIQDMSQGQTNGIPQGSALMDFIAEMVLGYIDRELVEKIEKEKILDFEILRYRDDYRIFFNNSQDGENIVKHLIETLRDFGLKLNSYKTRQTYHIIRDSIKTDKLASLPVRLAKLRENKITCNLQTILLALHSFLEQSPNSQNLCKMLLDCDEEFKKQKSTHYLQIELLAIHSFSEQFPNSGSLYKKLSDYDEKIKKQEEIKNLEPLISIIVDIAHHNPKVYSLCASVLSKLLSLLKDRNEKKEIIEKIQTKIRKKTNTGFMELWLQRITIKISENHEYEELLCKHIAKNIAKNKDNLELKPIWNLDWLSNTELKKAINHFPIIDKQKMAEMSDIIASEEIAVFPLHSY